MPTKTTANPKRLTGYRCNRFWNADEDTVRALTATFKIYGYDEYEEQSPIVILGTEVVNGRHRVLAAQRAKLASVPVIEVTSAWLEAAIESLGRALDNGYEVVAGMAAEAV